MGQLGSGPRVVSRLGSGVWVNASFLIFALTVGGNVLGEEGNCPGGEMSGWEYVRWGYVSRGNVLHDTIG